MRIISHRGNLDGIYPELENNPMQIQKCIDLGYDVEIDLRIKDDVPHLGHDEAQYSIDQKWLNKRKSFLWIHVKEHAALIWLIKNVPDSTYFCHQSDEFTVVNNGFIWLHDLNNEMNDRCVIPLLGNHDILKFNFQSTKNKPGHICTDFVFDLQKILNSINGN